MKGKKTKKENAVITIEADDTTVVIDTEGGNSESSSDQVETPVRQSGESGQTFMARCMFDATMVVQFPDQSQRNSACDRILNGEVTKNMKSLSVLKWHSIKNVSIRRESKNGLDFIVVPIIALVEGVHAGSGGAVMYPGAEIQRTAGDWNGVPLTIDHPEVDGNHVSALNPEVLTKWAVGTFENVRFENGKLVGEGWISLERVQEISPKTLQLIQEGHPLEVSTGLFTTSDNQSGTFNGESFDSTVSDFVPDHLALLPNDVGACSFQDGCGVRSNKEQGCGSDACRLKRSINIKELKAKGGEDKIDEKELMKLKDAFITFNKSFDELSLNELSHSKVREQLIGIVNDMDVAGVSVNFLREVFNDRFIFEKIDMENNKRTLFSQKFSINKEDLVNVKGEAKEVREKIEFIDVNFKKEDNVDEREKLVNALIQNEKAPYDESDREHLTNMEDGKFENTVKFVDCQCKENLEEQEEETPAPAANKAEAKPEVVVNAEKKEVSISDLPVEAQAVFNRGIAKYEQEKKFLIEGLLKNSRNPFPAEVLNAKDVDELEGLCALAKVPVFLGNRAPATNLDIENVSDDTPSMPSYTQIVLNKGLMDDGTQLSMT